jgi:hypothetical protein
VTGVNKLGKTTQTVNLLKAPKKMTEIMRVKIHSPSIKEFDPLSAVHLWNVCFEYMRCANIVSKKCIFGGFKD